MTEQFFSPSLTSQTCFWTLTKRFNQYDTAEVYVSRFDWSHLATGLMHVNESPGWHQIGKWSFYVVSYAARFLSGIMQIVVACDIGAKCSNINYRWKLGINRLASGCMRKFDMHSDFKYFICTRNNYCQMRANGVEKTIYSKTKETWSEKNYLENGDNQTKTS